MQDAHRKGHFIGRVKEMQIFQEWLNDPNAPHVLYIHDAAEETSKKGGVGKTSLLYKYIEMARESHKHITVVMADFFSVNNRDRVFLTQKILAGLEQLYPGWKPLAFNLAAQSYGSQVITSGSSESVETQIRREVGAALTEDLQRLDTYLAETQKMLLVIFDTFETIEQNPLSVVLRLSQTFPDEYQLNNMRTIIAGRNRLDWSHPNWQGRESEVKVIALDPFNPQEMQEYITNEAFYNISPDSEQTKAFYERTEGRPIIIGLAIDVLNHRILSLKDLITVSKTEFESYLIPQVNKLENPLNWVILFMAHVYHRFNMPILECILKGVDIHTPTNVISMEELFRVLPELSFVRQAGSEDEFVLHDEMRRLVTRYCWGELDQYKRNRKDISRSVITYYEQEVLSTAREPQRQEYIIEILHHRLFVDPDDGLGYFQAQFQNALNALKTAFARLLLQEAQSFVDSLSLVQQNEMRLTEAKLYRTEDAPQPALLLLNKLRLESDAQWYAEHQIDLLMEEGRSYILQSRLLEAAERFKKSLELIPAGGNELQSASCLINLGLIARYRGEFSMALNYYEQSMAIFKKLHRQDDYATALNNTAIVYRRQGKLEEALRRGKIAWQIRLNLFREGKTGEWLVGTTLNNLGQVYLEAGNIVEAEHRFNEALEIYRRSNDKTGIAGSYNRFGTIQLAKGELQQARTWFIKANEAAQDLNADQYINSLNKQGQVCLRLNQWEDAVQFFKRAISTSQPLPDYFQETENLIDLANALFHLGQNEEAQQSLQQGEEIARRENYLAFLGRIEQQRAEVYYQVQDYIQAFHHFTLYCEHMLAYNYSSYIASVQVVVDALLGVPKSEVPALVQELSSYWIHQHLEKNYPELIQACEEVDDFMIQ